MIRNPVFTQPNRQRRLDKIFGFSLGMATKRSVCMVIGWHKTRKESG